MLKLFIILLISNLSMAGEKIKVMSIDTGVSLSHQEIRDHVNVKNWIKEDYTDSHRIGHGTHVAGIIVKNTCKEVELVSCKYYYGEGLLDAMQNTVNCFKRALNENIDIINYSSTGLAPISEEFEVLQKLRNKNVIIVSAAGNEGVNILVNKRYLSAYNLSNIVVVGNLESNGIKSTGSNFGFPGMVWELGTNVYSTLPDGKFGYLTGSSQAAAIHTNRLLKQKCKELN